MPVAFRSASTGYTGPDSGSIVQVAKPAGVVAGDVLIAVVTVRSPTTNVTASGWTILAGSDDAALCWKVAGPSEPFNYTFGNSAGQTVETAAVVACYSGAHPTAPIDVFATAQTGTEASPAVTASVASGVVVRAINGRYKNNDAGTISAGPTGTALRGAVQSQAIPTALADQALDGASVDAALWDITGELIGGENAGIQTWTVVLRSPNEAPNAPTNLSPDGVTINKDAAQRFSWAFSDPDPGDSQSKYDLRYRPNDGVSAWTTVTANTPTTYRDFAAGTFAAGDWEWQVRTYDAAGVVGPYSASAFFTAAAPPPGPVFTAPLAGSTIPSDTQTFTISTPDLDRLEWQVVDAVGTVLGGAVIANPSARSFTATGLPNGATITARARTEEVGLWSPWVETTHPVSYTAPAQPTVTVTADIPTGAISMQATHPTPTGSQPTVTSVDWWRQEVDDTGNPTAEPVALARGASQASSGTFTDWQIGSDRRYRYRARAVGANGTSSWSDWTLGEDVDTPGAVLPATLPFVLG